MSLSPFTAVVIFPVFLTHHRNTPLAEQRAEITARWVCHWLKN